MKFIDLTGRRFGRLIVIERSKTVNKHTMWRCQCDCGREKIAESHNLICGHTQSCGCLQREATSRANTKHGMRNTRLYTIWNCMKNRCYQRSYHAYNHYGGRGITVCDEWLKSFNDFYSWAMSNGYQDNLSIDRIDVNKGYSPENCRWVSMREQNKNKRAENGYKIKE